MTDTLEKKIIRFFFFFRPGLFHHLVSPVQLIIFFIHSALFVMSSYLSQPSNCYRVRTHPGEPGIYWNLIIRIPGLEYTGILSKVLENTGI